MAEKSGKTPTAARSEWLRPVTRRDETTTPMTTTTMTAMTTMTTLQLARLEQCTSVRGAPDGGMLPIFSREVSAQTVELDSQMSATFPGAQVVCYVPPGVAPPVLAAPEPGFMYVMIPVALPEQRKKRLRAKNYTRATFQHLYAHERYDNARLIDCKLRFDH